MPDAVKQQFTIILEGSDDVTPVFIRLRHALKLLLRAFRLRCVQIDPVVAITADPATNPGSAAIDAGGPAGNFDQE